ncbi:MAG: hypothetical protein SNJ77_13105, partial [Cytophagales bacterium]
MLRFLFYAWFLGLFFSVLSGYSQAVNLRIKKIIDGDTYYGEDSLKNQYKIRLKEVDCPEKNQKYGINAKEYVEK